MGFINIQEKLEKSIDCFLNKILIHGQSFIFSLNARPAISIQEGPYYVEDMIVTVRIGPISDPF